MDTSSSSSRARTKTTLSQWLVVLLLLTVSYSSQRHVQAFVLIPVVPRLTTRREAAGRGFGPPRHNDQTNQRKTYGDDDVVLSSNTRRSSDPSSPLDVSDEDISDFFSSQQHHNVLRTSIWPHLVTPTSLAAGAIVEASSLSSLPTPLPAQPADPDKQVLAVFLDALHQSLLDIPVAADDDVQFLEEGRRVMALERFHVVTSREALLETAWREVLYLTRQQSASHTGSLICVATDTGGNSDDFSMNLQQLAEWVDANLRQPLQWLNPEAAADLEIVALERGVPALRILYRVEDIPDIPQHDDNDNDDADE